MFIHLAVPRIKSWLEPERARLEALRSLNIDASTWDRNGRDAAFLDHRGKRLAEANALVEMEGYRKRVGKAEFEYLAACQEAERLAQRRSHRMQALVGVLAFGVVTGLVGWLNQSYLHERLRWFTTMRPYLLAHVQPHVLTVERQDALKPGDSFRECAKECPEMIVIPTGEFIMGSPKEEDGRWETEGPQHKVVFARPFAVSKFEVTFEQWDACVEVGGCARVSNSGVVRGTQPVVNVSWKDAQRYVAWFSRMTGQIYRLLSEAEWEYAARGGSEKAYSWGGEVGKEKAHCLGCGSQQHGSAPIPVGSFAANAFGLHDMHGNVWEWVDDCWHDDYAESPPDDGSVWATRCKDNSRRVIRGGSWHLEPRYLRAASRHWNDVDYRDNGLGFRVGRVLSR